MTDAMLSPDNLARIVMLAFGAMEHGGPYWCYVAVKPSRFSAFQDALAGAAYDMRHFESDQFGEIVVSGEGRTPPKEISLHVAKLFGVAVSELFTSEDPLQEINDKLSRLKTK